MERLRRPPEPVPGEAKPFIGETSERAQEALERACRALSSAPPGTRDATIGQVVYRVGRLAAAGELDPESALAALLKAVASNPGTDKRHRDKVERCFRDGFKNPAEPGPIDDRRPRTTSASGIMPMIIATAAAPVIAMMMTPASVPRAR
jgi:hypothetical protein